MKKNTILICLFFGMTMILSQSIAVSPNTKPIREIFKNIKTSSLVISINDEDFSKANALMKDGANINEVGAEGISPLLWIMIYTRDLIKIEYALKNGANPNYIYTKNMVSPMYLAAGGNSSEILELLLKNKGDPNMVGPDQESLLMVATSQFREKNINLLLKYGADVNIIDSHNDTVANNAARYGRFDLVTLFLEQGLTSNLQGLARSVEVRSVPENSQQQYWKNKCIFMLKERGAKFPDLTPR